MRLMLDLHVTTELAVIAWTGLFSEHGMRVLKQTAVLLGLHHKPNPANPEPRRSQRPALNSKPVCLHSMSTYMPLASGGQEINSTAAPSGVFELHQFNAVGFWPVGLGLLVVEVVTWLPFLVL